MNFSKVHILLLTLSILCFNCSTVKVVDSWSSENLKSVKSKNILVIARTANKSNRKAYESKMAQRLRSGDIQATESYLDFPNINPKDSLTEEKVNRFKEKLKTKGYNAVVLSVIKGVEEISNTTIEGGHEAGATMSSYYNWDVIGFWTYYSNPMSLPPPSFGGVYEDPTLNTITAKVYVLETSVFNLDLPKEEQLLAVVTSKIDDPARAHSLAGKYADAVFEAVKNKS